ncbi:hypothetical protein PPTG_06989 [Phytophthora nicotianae INRA-310]|uniref:Uncharacterized protein n=1 Tax=Phytophthora nicotianae (strain INRA-310) TaxID=761204 RepID=W2QS93_PHYN3|nr:hypothetical protein PPTG_06989 [Phytophthora nicotianae INRA-310]ETN15791.1 hypothetical protein PPTG_06989 [Phytophthora nicotianae INRA-310]
MGLSSKVHPVALEKPQLVVVAVDTFDRAIQAAGDYWNRLQVGHRGRYSVQRLLSLRDYCERTSPIRVFLVCTMSLVPSFIMAMLVECIPLKPPDEGWKANYAFWIRLYVSSLPTAFGAVFQVKEVIEPGVISRTGVLITGIGSCTCYVALTMLIAVVWKFPIPFGYVLTVAPFVFFYMVFFILSIGPGVLRKSPKLRHQLKSQMTVIAAQGVLAIAYPTFSAVFNQLSATQQSIFIFVLPLIKFVVKQVIAKASAHLRECVGLIVVFSVDVCNVLYVVVCMQTAISPVTTTVMITSDAFFVILALRSIYYQLDSTQGRLQSMNSSKVNYLDDLLVLMRDIFRETNGTPVPIRVCAPLALPMSIESTRYLNDILKSRRRNAHDVESFTFLPIAPTATTSTQSMRCSLDRQHDQGELDWAVLNATLAQVTTTNSQRVLPARHSTDKLVSGPQLPMTVPSRTSTQRTEPRSKRRITVTSSGQDTSVQDVQNALQTLFHSEYVVMGEYIECAIPVLYSVYLTFLYHLPTAAYYPHTRCLTPEKFARAVMNLLLYSLVEFASFTGLSIVLRRKFGFSPLYQLAFVLETQVATLQGHLFLWISVILQMTLVHNGVDLEAPFK